MSNVPDAHAGFIAPEAPGNREGAAAERRNPRVVTSGPARSRTDVAQFIARHRLESFHGSVHALAIAVFGAEATVVPHFRTVGEKRRLTFVVDAADPAAGVDYEAFLPRERAFWTAYAHVPKPDVPVVVAVRPARGWCRVEALAPMFAFMPTGEFEA